MAIIDVVKWEMSESEFCHKFPSDNLRLGTQLVVYPSQTAFFVKGGTICDEFSSGTYTIQSENIPLLHHIINIPFGNETPFTAEVWFINQVCRLNLQWGTPQPLQIEDPKYHIIVPVRAHGQYGIRISNPRRFLETLIGNMTSFTSEKIEQYFKGRIITSLNTLLTNQIIGAGTSVLDINTLLMNMSIVCNQQLNEQFDKYGVSIVDFSIMSVTVPQDDPSVIKLKQAKDIAARISITGRDVYQMERSFDVLEKAASNEGAGGQMLAMGAGLGAGVGVGGVMGNMTSQMMNTNAQQVPPPIPQTRTYHVYVGGQQISGKTRNDIAEFIHQGIANADTLVWAPGMVNWQRIADTPEISDLVQTQTPPPISI